MAKRLFRNSKYDVVVVGARCAGAATALLLARSGLSVLAVDKSRHGSDTLSTHALMRGGVFQLHRWDVLKSIRDAGTPPVKRTTFHYGDRSVEIEIKPKDGIDALYAPRRTVLDALLADAAETAGAEIVRGPRIVDLIRGSDERVGGVVAELEPGNLVRIGADVVVGADGVRSTVARLVNAPTNVIGRYATGLAYGYWEGLDLPGYHWHFRAGVSAGSIATNGGTLVFAGIPQDRFKNEMRYDLGAVFRRVLRDAAPELAEAVSSAKRKGRLRGYAGQIGFMRQSWGSGWALVGDSGYFKDPVTAHGITDAFRDAELLAWALRNSTPANLSAYQAIRDRLSLRLFHLTDEVASLNWDFETLEGLHREMSIEMKEEVRRLALLGKSESAESILDPDEVFPKAS